LSVSPGRIVGIMIPFNAVRSPAGDIVVFYVGAEPRLTSEQALDFAEQLRALATETHPAR
jgi:xanthosine utilization system XapX-like protein